MVNRLRVLLTLSCFALLGASCNNEAGTTLPPNPTVFPSDEYIDAANFIAKVRLVSSAKSCAEAASCPAAPPLDSTDIAPRWNGAGEQVGFEVMETLVGTVNVDSIVLPEDGVRRILAFTKGNAPVGILVGRVEGPTRVCDTTSTRAWLSLDLHVPGALWIQDHSGEKIVDAAYIFNNAWSFLAGGPHAGGDMEAVFTNEACTDCFKMSAEAETEIVQSKSRHPNRPLVAIDGGVAAWTRYLCLTCADALDGGCSDASENVHGG